MTNIRNAGLYATLMGMLATPTIGGGGRSHTHFNNRAIGTLQLPEDFTGYFFVRETGELIDDKWSKKRIEDFGEEGIFKVMSRSEELAREVFERKTKFKKRTVETKSRRNSKKLDEKLDETEKIDSVPAAKSKIESMLVQLALRKGARKKKKLQKQINELANQWGIVLK